MNALTDIERIRVWAASGASVTLDPDDLRCLARLFDQSQRYETNGDASYERALQVLTRAKHLLIANIIYSVAAGCFLLGWAVFQ